MIWKVLKHQDFARLFIATLISEIGSKVHRIALLVMIYAMTGDVVGVSMALAVQMLATVAVAPLISVWADTQERRRLLVASDWLRVLLVALIPLLGIYHIGLLLALVFVIEVLRSLHDPVANAVVPDLVPAEALDSANGLMLFCQRFAEVAFVGLAGVLVAVLGPQPAFWIDALSYLASGLILLTLPQLHSGSVKRADYWTRVREGIAYLVKQPAIRSTVGTLFAAAMFGSVEAVLGVVLAVSVLQVGSAGFGALEAMIAFGAVLGTFMVPQLTTRIARERLFLLGLLGFGLLESSIGAFPIFGWALVAYFLSGQLNMIFVIPARSILQLNTPPELRTRVFAAFGATMNGAVLIGTMLGGALEKPLGVPLIFVFAGLMVSAVALGSLLRAEMAKPRFAPQVLEARAN